MIRTCAFLLAALGASLLSGCTTTGSEDPNNVSTIPWNHPEKWEGQGPMGGMMNSR